MYYRRRWALVNVLLFSILAGCSNSTDEGDSDDDDQTGPPPAVMTGTWKFESVTVDGAIAKLDSVQEWQAQTANSRLHIQANSAYVFEEVNSTGGQLWFESGFVFVEDPEIEFNAQQDSDGAADETTLMTYTVNDSVFTLQQTDNGKVIEYSLRR